jgi:acylpyruvate hydrolase
LGKSFDTCTPVSHFISKDEIKNPNEFTLWCKVNNEFKQNFSISDMVFSISDLISFISKYMSLEPNDLILTGTPAGAGKVNEGDSIECGLAGGSDIVKMQFVVEKDK